MRCLGKKGTGSKPSKIFLNKLVSSEAPVHFFSGKFKTIAVIAAFTLAGFLAATIAANAAINDSDSGTDGIKKAGYKIVKSSGKLKWLPYRPEQDGVEQDATSAEQVARWTSEAPAAHSRQSTKNAFDNPFGDKNSTAASEVIEESGEPLMLPPAEPDAGTATPSFPNTTKTKSVHSFALQEKQNAMQPKADNSNNAGAQDQTLEQALTAKSPDSTESCPSVKDLKKISQLSTNITPSQGDLPKDCPWGGEDFEARCWAPVTFTWTASGLCHHPLYFEEIQLERYGHALGPWLQPFASHAHFFLTLPILPYKMGLEVPNECMYTLGYYRPGSCAPYMLDPLPLSIRAGLFEAGAWVAGVAIIP